MYLKIKQKQNKNGESNHWSYKRKERGSNKCKFENGYVESCFKTQ